MSRRTTLSPCCLPLAAWLFSVIASGVASHAANAGSQYNVLLIAVDDLRPALRCYGDRTANTPNIDRLAARGAVFERAYCQQALCNPSRASLLSGRRPDTLGVYDLDTNVRANIPDLITLPQLFRINGYHTQAVGKIFHAALRGIAKHAHHVDQALSWSVPWWTPEYARYHTPEGIDSERRFFGIKPSVSNEQMWRDHPYHRGLVFEAGDAPDADYADGQIAKKAVEVLQELAVMDEPFFLAVGFLKPHLPFVAPKKYFELYDLDEMPLPGNPHYTQQAPAISFENWVRGQTSTELRTYFGLDWKSDKAVTEVEQMRLLIRAYYACVSFIDAQVGRLLDTLDRLELSENTIVVLFGDHGFHLGDNGIWGKFTNFEAATRAPLIVIVPGKVHCGSHTSALVEFVDVYPSLADACGLAVDESVEGTSFLPLLENPHRLWKNAVFSQHPRRHLMGHSIRTDRYRLTRWSGEGSGPIIELYDYETDPLETRNHAEEPAYTAIRAELLERLEAGWRTALPAE